MSESACMYIYIHTHTRNKEQEVYWDEKEGSLQLLAVKKCNGCDYSCS